MTTPRRPRKCGRCTMFGHDRRSCHHLLLENDDDCTAEDLYRIAMNNYQRHCYLNGQWVSARGAGHTVPSPKMEDFIKKTQFELACENKCKVIHEDTCCICMEDLGEKNTATTPCGHQFHFGCLAQHCDLKTTCPTCRAVIRPEYKKKDIKLPTSTDLNAFAARAAAAMIPAIANLTENDDQAAMFTEVIVHVVNQSNLALVSGIRDANGV